MTLTYTKCKTELGCAMRFIHTDCRPIVKFIEAERYIISEFKLDENFSRNLSVSQMRDYLIPKVYLGDIPPTYLYLHHDPIDHHDNIQLAVDDIEDDLEENSDFIVAHYYDNDVISISKNQLPFQLDVEPADWWVPKYKFKPWYKFWSKD